jgi:hypothetical protein
LELIRIKHGPKGHVKAVLDGADLEDTDSLTDSAGETGEAWDVVVIFSGPEAKPEDSPPPLDLVASQEPPDIEHADPTLAPRPPSDSIEAHENDSDA